MLWVLAAFCAACVAPTIAPLRALALIVDGGVVFRSFQAGGPGNGTTKQEYIELYNNSDNDVDVTNWCVTYNSSIAVACVTPPDLQTRVYLSSHESALIMSPELEDATRMVTPEFHADILFTTTTNLFPTNGYLKLLDHTGAMIDALGWGTSIGEGAPTSEDLPKGNIFQRISLNETLLKDTQDNLSDFEVILSPDILRRGGLYELAVQVDLCPNTELIDAVLPVGYLHDESGDCYEDLCDNIIGLQKFIPNGYSRIDIDCKPLALQITELLPNAAGSDAGNEFVELYNPNSVPIDLTGYYLRLDTNSKKHPIPDGSMISAGSYMVFSDTELKLTLPNTTGVVLLFTPNDMPLDETAPYHSPDDNQAWALLDNDWQITQLPTPGAANKPTPPKPPAVSEEEATEPCPEGKFRNPETNRCKNVAETASSLLPCGSGEVRNPETNRCRKIVSTTSSLTPCKPDQERNPETNRCRQIASASTSTVPCQEGYERNPDTNRCRKVVAGSVAGAATFPASSPAPLHPGVLLSLTFLTIAYGIYEYRYDLGNLAHKLRSKQVSKK